MYVPPQSFKRLVSDMTPIIGKASDAKLLIYVELTLYLARLLELYGEPLTVGWVLLSRMPLYDFRLNNLTSDQRQMLAKASAIVPLSSRYAWENALVRYAKTIPQERQLYRINPSARLDDQFIETCFQENHPEVMAREVYYQEILTDDLLYQARPRLYTKVDRTYRVYVKTANDESRYGRVKITKKMQQRAEENPVWFDTERPRTVLTITLNELHPTAEFLDECERQAGERLHWVRDLEQIHFRKVTINDGKISLEDEGAYPLHLEGQIHIPGMVSAGKTTLAKLVIAHCILNDVDIRITLVVGDSTTAVEIAHQVNSWFLNDPSGDDVFAVPLLGKTQRETHLGRLLASRHYKRALEHGRPHWGERWLMPVCPLASQIVWEGEANITIPAGNEPCEALRDEPTKDKKRPKRHLCPLHSICPSKQMYRDMPKAKLWVTTPGALAQASLPFYLDNRILNMGDLVYEQSDLVILDEVETIVDWYDRAFARRQPLTNGKDGLLDRLDTQISTYLNSNRVLSPDTRRWIFTARDSIKALSSILTSLALPEQERVAKQWVQNRHFAPHQLAYRLARRLAGLKEWDDAKTSVDERKDNERLTREAFEPFNELLNVVHDPLRPGAIRALPSDSGARELVGLLQEMNNVADDMSDFDFLESCVAWIKRCYPDIEMRLTALYEHLCESSDTYDHDYIEKYLDRSVNELAGRLYFLLTVILLDRHLYIVFQEWHNKPEELNAEDPFQRIPRAARLILPLPLTGQQYGFVADTSGSNQNRDTNHLSLFIYSNIGRTYLLNFHRLREDFEGMPGPHVLALSGTSYLPDSTPFHVNIPPEGILMPSSQTEKAIEDSRFIWRYFTDKKGKPIFISGHGNKERALQNLVTAMLEDGGVPGGFIGHVLAWLEKQDKKNPAQWEDRARILLFTNSYSQAKVVAQTLREGWRNQSEHIFHLKRGSQEDYEISGQNVPRMDIEQFAQIGGRILVAPMQAIGRGFNILNNSSERKAAFGAVFFLTRPMNMPNDMEATAQELNRYALEWAADHGFSAWQEDSLYKRALRAREKAVELRRSIQRRSGYGDLHNDAELRLYPRRDLAATTAGRVIQAVGRLMRGGVPFRAYFIDAAWSPELAKTGDKKATEPAETSLLTALIDVLDDYARENEVGEFLYSGLSGALITTENRDGN